MRLTLGPILKCTQVRLVRRCRFRLAHALVREFKTRQDHPDSGLLHAAVRLQGNDVIPGSVRPRHGLFCDRLPDHERPALAQLLTNRVFFLPERLLPLVPYFFFFAQLAFILVRGDLILPAIPGLGALHPPEAAAPLRDQGSVLAHFCCDRPKTAFTGRGAVVLLEGSAGPGTLGFSVAALSGCEPQPGIRSEVGMDRDVVVTHFGTSQICSPAGHGMRSDSRTARCAGVLL